MTNEKAGKKASKKYITLDSGVDFRKIAEKMTELGYQMNHATARNQLMVAMEKLVGDVAKQAGARLTKSQLSALLQNQTVHDAIADILHVIHETKDNDTHEEVSK